MSENNKNNERDFEFESFFDNLITKGYIEKEREILKGFTVKVRPLNSDEQIGAESITIANNPYVPRDTIEKIRVISMLSKAIVSVNGVAIEGKEARKKLHEKLLSLPTHINDDLYALYVDCIEEQRKLYMDEELGEKIEAF